MLSTIFLTNLAIFTLAAAVPQLPDITRSFTIILDASATYSRLPAETQVEKMCQPRMEAWEYGTEEEVKAAGLDGYASLEDIWKDSPFPCERILGILYTCVPYVDDPRNEEGAATFEDIEAERACLCPSKYWELHEACAMCEGIHGYGSEHAESTIAYYRDFERLFCNETVPDVNYYQLGATERYYREMAGLRGYSETPLPDKFPGKTDVSIYYTDGVRPTITDSYDYEGRTVITNGPEAFTRPSTFAVTPTATPDARTTAAPGGGEGEGGGGGGGGGGGEGTASPATASSTADAPKLKVAGWMVMAMLGAMVML